MLIFLKTSVCVFCVFQILRPYASTLKSLIDVGVYDRVHFPTRDWSALEHFTRLDKLYIGTLASEGWITGVATALRNSGTVTELGVDRIQPPADIIADVLLGLDQLRSLTLNFRGFDEIGHPLRTLASLTNLTKLVIAAKRADASIGELTGLVCLDILYYQSFTDIAGAISNLLLLEELSIRSIQDICLSGHTFFRMTRLRRLDIGLRRLMIEEDFFPVLGSLKQLTSLKLFSGFASEWVSHQHISKITLLTNLKELMLRLEDRNRRQEVDPLRYFIENSFPRLRTLHITGVRSSEGIRHELMTKLPCLSSLVLNND